MEFDSDKLWTSLVMVGLVCIGAWPIAALFALYKWWRSM